MRQRASPAWAETRCQRGSVVTLTFERHGSTQSRPPSGREAPHLEVICERLVCRVLKTENYSPSFSYSVKTTKQSAISGSDYFAQINQRIKLAVCIECAISIYQFVIFQLLKRRSARVFYLDVN